MTDYPESFADYPKTFGERRADSSEENSATVWKPRDALITLLRRIDSGEVNIDALIIAYRIPGNERGTNSAGYLQASPDNYTSVGILQMAAHMITKDATV